MDGEQAVFVFGESADDASAHRTVAEAETYLDGALFFMRMLRRVTRLS